MTLRTERPQDLSLQGKNYFERMLDLAFINFMKYLDFEDRKDTRLLSLGLKKKDFLIWIITKSSMNSKYIIVVFRFSRFKLIFFQILEWDREYASSTTHSILVKFTWSRIPIIRLKMIWENTYKVLILLILQVYIVKPLQNYSEICQIDGLSRT